MDQKQSPPRHVLSPTADLESVQSEPSRMEASLEPVSCHLSASLAAFTVVVSERDQSHVLLEDELHEHQNLEGMLAEAWSALKDHLSLLCSFQKTLWYDVNPALYENLGSFRR